MNKSVRFGGILLTLAALPLQANDWTPIGEDRRGTTWSLETGSTRSDGGHHASRLRIDFKSPQPYLDPTLQVKTILLSVSIRCTDARLGITGMHLLDQEGRELERHAHEESQGHAPHGLPQTLVQSTIARACA